MAKMDRKNATRKGWNMTSNAMRAGERIRNTISRVPRPTEVQEISRLSG